MSLDVSLSRVSYLSYDKGATYTEQKDEVYWANITHNLGEMARHVNVLHNTLYEYLWRPEEIGIKNSSDLVYPLTIGLAMLKDNPEYYKQFNASNGWGKYEHFVPFVEQYLNACIENPDCEVYASR